VIKSIAEHVMSRIDRDAFDVVRARHEGGDTPSWITKYLALDQWIEVNVRRAVALDLHRAGPRRILDIGTGCGYFPFVCRVLGHQALAIDHPDRSPAYRDVCRLLCVDVLDHEVVPAQPLPQCAPLDVITAYMITFNGHCTSPWGADEWLRFVTDARSRLCPGGSILLELNREPPPLNACYTPELRAAFVGAGAEITGHWPHRPDAVGHRLMFRGQADAIR
jgi:hypothetical protein